MVLELTFQRASVHPVHDAKRLEEGKDLNDALLDFFVKLGQALIPENLAAGAPPPVAFLGSHFFDVLRKGGVKDGREGHKNVANWAKRRLGKEGIFSDGIGALAVPVNEVLWNSSYDGRQPTQEKHWWLALLLNPRAAASPQGSDEDVSLLCLDSFVRSETSFEPPHRAVKGGGSLEAYTAEVLGLSREGFNVRLRMRARGDGSAGPLAEPRKARLKAGGRDFGCADHEFKTRDLGAAGKPGVVECSLSYRLDRRGAAKTGGEYVLAYGDAAENYQPALKLRMGAKPTGFQAEVARFLGGYLAKERETALGLPPCGGKEAEEPKASQLESAVCLPGVPQQETAHDCGFFILEMILRALQLSPKALRELATASAVEIAMLPWPSQRQVFRRKAMLRDALDALLVAARQQHTGDVEAILKADSKLRLRIRSALLEGGPSFTHGFERWAVGDWDLSASPSRSKSGSVNRGRAEGAKKAKKKRRRGSSSSSEEAARRRRRRRGRSSSDSDRSRSLSRSSASRSKAAPMAKAAPAQAPAPPAPPPPSYTMQDLEGMGAGALRALCMQRNVLPVGIVERGDLLKALAPFALPAPAPAPAPAANAVQAQAQAHPANAGAVQSLTREALEAQTTKALRALCIQHGVLMRAPVERGDLVDALVKLATTS